MARRKGCQISKQLTHSDLRSRPLCIARPRMNTLSICLTMELHSHQIHRSRPNSSADYVRHRPETTLLYQVVQEYWPEFQAELASHDKYLPAYVTKEFDEYLKCGRLEHGFLRVRCESCHDEKLVAFSCKRRGFCPSCGTRRMADSAALLVDEILPHKPMRQWVLSVPFPLRFLFASNPQVMTRVLAIVYRTIATYLTHKAGYTKSFAQTGAVTLIQRFGSALNLNIHFHMLFLDGVYIGGSNGHPMRFLKVKAPTKVDLTRLAHIIAQRVGRYLERRGLWARVRQSGHDHGGRSFRILTSCRCCYQCQ